MIVRVSVVNVTSNSPSQDYTHLDDHNLPNLLFLLHLPFLLTTFLLLQVNSLLLLLNLLNAKLAGGILCLCHFAFSPFLHLLFLLYICDSDNNLFAVSVDTYLVTKLYRWCRLTTDTPPIRYRYLTDSSPIYCRHTTDAIATDRLLLFNLESAICDIFRAKIKRIGIRRIREIT